MTRRDGDVGDLADQSTPCARSREAGCLRRAIVDAKRSDGGPSRLRCGHGHQSFHRTDGRNCSQGLLKVRMMKSVMRGSMLKARSSILAQLMLISGKLRKAHPHPQRQVLQLGEGATLPPDVT